MRTAFVAHPDCGRHDTGWRHPEHQGRLPAVMDALYRDTPALLDVVLQAGAEHAPEAALLRVHPPEHLAAIRVAAEEAGRAGEPVYIEADTVVSAASWDAALAAAGCAVTATDLVLSGRVPTAFAVSRPPGHHAGTATAMGFCLLNNVAIAARHAQAVHGVDRVLIVDWDVHHGNGTQDIFYHDPSVYFLSLHMSPHYPGTGAASERGAGAGAGTTRNVPLRPRTPRHEHLAAFDEALDAALAEFRPELILVSAGMDCMAGDPLGGLLLEAEDIHAMARRLKERADQLCGGRVVAVLEGGYVPARLGLGVVNVLRAFADLPPASALG